MKIDFNKIQKGATLLEVLLVLAVIGLLFTMGIKIYQSFQNTLQLQAIKDNVDQLFDAASSYYKANCATGDFSPRGSVSYPPATPYAVSIPNVLLQDGYLMNWNPANAFVNSTVGDLGYVVQLNPVVLTRPITVNACVVLNPGTSCVPVTPANVSHPSTPYSATPTSSIPTAQAQVVFWTVQVSVAIQKTKLVAYASILGADCISGSMINGVVASCSGMNPGLYAVWTRSASSSIKKNSIFTPSMQLLQQYNLQYTHDRNYEFNSGYSTTTAPLAPVYYLCGG